MNPSDTSSQLLFPMEDETCQTPDAFISRVQNDPELEEDARQISLFILSIVKHQLKQQPKQLATVYYPTDVADLMHSDVMVAGDPNVKLRVVRVNDGQDWIIVLQKHVVVSDINYYDELWVYNITGNGQHDILFKIFDKLKTPTTYFYNSRKAYPLNLGWMYRKHVNLPRGSIIRTWKPFALTCYMFQCLYSRPADTRLHHAWLPAAGSVSLPDSLSDVIGGEKLLRVTQKLVCLPHCLSGYNSYDNRWDNYWKWLDMYNLWPRHLQTKLDESLQMQCNEPELTNVEEMNAACNRELCRRVYIEWLNTNHEDPCKWGTHHLVYDYVRHNIKSQDSHLLKSVEKYMGNEEQLVDDSYYITASEAMDQLRDLPRRKKPNSVRQVIIDLKYACWQRLYTMNPEELGNFVRANKYTDQSFVNWTFYNKVPLDTSTLARLRKRQERFKKGRPNTDKLWLEALLRRYDS